jgi:hypothetical protein
MGQKEFDSRSWSYKYSWVDKTPAAQRENRFDPETNTYREGFSRQNLVHQAEVLGISRHLSLGTRFLLHIQ